MLGRATFTMVLSSPTRKRLEAQTARMVHRRAVDNGSWARVVSAVVVTHPMLEPGRLDP
jgi:hypothetical protein